MREDFYQLVEDVAREREFQLQRRKEEHEKPGSPEYHKDDQGVENGKNQGAFYAIRGSHVASGRIVGARQRGGI